MATQLNFNISQHKILQIVKYFMFSLIESDEKIMINYKILLKSFQTWLPLSNNIAIF